MARPVEPQDFEEVHGITFYTGPSDPPTSEQWDAYLATAPDEKTRAEWAKLRPEGV